jgi:hypothetical protein
MERALTEEVHTEGGTTTDHGVQVDPFGGQRWQRGWPN